MREKILCISQFKKCLEVGKEYYRTRIINPEDDDNEKQTLFNSYWNMFINSI